MAQPVITYMAKYPEFIKAPQEVNLIGVNGGKIECEIYGVPKPKITWFKDFAPLKETARRQAHHYPPQTHTLFFEDYITQGTYLITKNSFVSNNTADPNKSFQHVVTFTIFRRGFVYCNRFQSVWFYILLSYSANP